MNDIIHFHIYIVSQQHNLPPITAQYVGILSLDNTLINTQMINIPFGVLVEEFQHIMSNEH